MKIQPVIFCNSLKQMPLKRNLGQENLINKNCKIINSNSFNFFNMNFISFERKDKNSEIISFSPYKDFNSKCKKIVDNDSKSELPLIKSYKQNSLDKLLANLKNNPNHIIVIAVSGYSASGKSTVCEKLSQKLNEKGISTSIFHSDNYFKDISDLIKKYGSFDNLMKSGYDLDSPDNYYLDLLEKDLNGIRSGNTVYSPKYLINGTGISVPNEIEFSPSKVVIVEGMASSFLPKDLFDLSVIVDVDEDTRKKRFLNRAQERNMDEESAKKHWNYTNIAAKKHLEPCLKECDILINGKFNNDTISNFVDGLNLYFL